MAGAGGVPYLGSRIQLISKSEIRYEGTLYTIDTTNSTVALQNVRSFGTEDRKAEGVIAPSADVFDYIIFRGTDIKDLHVCETPTEEPTPTVKTGAGGPAAPPVNENVKPAEPAKPAAPKSAWGANPSAAARTPPAAQAPAANGKGAGKGAGGKGAGPQQPKTNQPRNQPGMGAHVAGRGTKSVDGGPAAQPAGEFDFIKALELGEKARQAALAESGKVQESSKYNKNTSFFDSLDVEAQEEGPRKGGRKFMEDQRKVDAQTFGEELMRERNARGGKGGGRGKGDGGGGGGKGGDRGKGGGKGTPREGGKGKGSSEGGRGGGRGKGGDRGKGEGGDRGKSKGDRGKGGKGSGSRDKDSETFGDMASSGAGYTGSGGRGGGGGGRGRGRGGKGAEAATAAA